MKPDYALIGRSIVDWDHVLATLARLVEVRHILAHEMLLNRPYEIAEVDGFISAARQFAGTVWEYVAQVLEPNYPTTQVEMTVAAYQQLADARRELKEAVNRFSAFVDAAALDECQRAWEHFAHL